MTTEKEKAQKMEWAIAQHIAFYFDIIAAAKQHLLFLRAVDRNRWLYGGPTLLKSIHRYKACWLPLLGKHTISPLTRGPLVVPLDCEWIWHCHRLNPLRYKSDCNSLFGRILGVSTVVSGTAKTCTAETEALWNTLYPDEPYEFRFDGETTTFPEIPNSTSYDLVSAAERQAPFFYQVSREFVENEVFLEEAVGRYKGFLHLIRRNRESSTRQFCVPTYDIDLIWHTHQLNPERYCKEVTEIVGTLLEHDDSDSDRTKGMKLDVGFSNTLTQWEDTFGTRYVKAGAMYRCAPPSPVRNSPLIPKVTNDPVAGPVLELPRLRVVEAYVEIVDMKNIEEKRRDSLLLVVSKKGDAFFHKSLKLKIESEMRRPWYFRCEPGGNLCFELRKFEADCYSILGRGQFSLDEIFGSFSKLAEERWIELENWNHEERWLKIALSFTPPIPSPHVFRFSNPNWFLAKLLSSKKWTGVIDLSGSKMLSLQMSSRMEKNSATKKHVLKMIESTEEKILADGAGNRWFIMDKHWHLRLKRTKDAEGCIAELVGFKLLKLNEGAKLDFEIRASGNKKKQRGLITVIEFSAENPYGKAVALLDLRSGSVEINEDWAVLPVILSAFIVKKAKKSQIKSISEEDTRDSNIDPTEQVHS